MRGEVKEWINKEFKSLQLPSKRLESRFKVVMSNFSDQPEKSVLLASGSRWDAKAVYRMLQNDKLREESILAAHRDATAERAPGGVLLAVQGTTSVNFNGHKKTPRMGYCADKTLGLNVHTCLPVTPDGIPIGVAEQSVSTRLGPKKEGSREVKRTRPIEEKESFRWLETMQTAAETAPAGTELIHVADREGDIYGLYALAQCTGQKFVIRAVHQRTDEDGQKIIEKLGETEPLGTLTVTIPENHAAKTKERDAILTIRSRSFSVRLPRVRRADKNLEQSLTLNLVSASEESPPSGSQPIEWLLMTNLSIDTLDNVREVVGIYRSRWKIERFHFVLKSGCAIEALQQRSVSGLSMMILMYSIISVQIMILTFLARSSPETPCNVIFSETERKVLYQAANKAAPPQEPFSVADAVRFVAKLGGFVGAPSDGAPGLKVIWLGLVTLYTLCSFRECLMEILLLL